MTEKTGLIGGVFGSQNNVGASAGWFLEGNCHNNTRAPDIIPKSLELNRRAAALIGVFREPAFNMKWCDLRTPRGPKDAERIKGMAKYQALSPTCQA